MTMSDFREIVNQYVKRVNDLAEHVRGNEQATKQSLIGPLFTSLGYDLTDPRECVPEYRVDFGRERSAKPIDWAFMQNGRPIFIVEAKEAGKRLVGYDEQLADYFAKDPQTKLGILTNGLQWKFYTDVVHANVMDREPFMKWDVNGNDDIPYDFLTLIQKSQFNPQLIRSFAQRQHSQNLLVGELNRLLEPSAEFIRLAVANIETRRLTESILESWKPVLANAIEEWAKQRMLSLVLNGPAPIPPADSTPSRKIVTTKEELEGFETIKGLLGEGRPVGYTDTVSYFKVHLPDRHTWVVCRLYLEGRRPRIWLPVPISEIEQWLNRYKVTFPQVGWICMSLADPGELESLGDILRATYDHQRNLRLTSPDGGQDAEDETPEEQEILDV
jgi:hypothetical protein